MQCFLRCRCYVAVAQAKRLWRFRRGSLWPYPEEGDAISPLSTKGEFTLTKNGVTTGSAGTADPAYSFTAYHSKRGIALGSTLSDLAAAYPELSFNVIYGQSEDFKVQEGVAPGKIASQAKAGKRHLLCALHGAQHWRRGAFGKGV